MICRGFWFWYTLWQRIFSTYLVDVQPLQIFGNFSLIYFTFRRYVQIVDVAGNF